MLEQLEKVKAHPWLVVGSSFGLLYFLFIRRALPVPIALVSSPYALDPFLLTVLALLCPKGIRKDCPLYNTPNNHGGTRAWTARYE